MKRAKARHRTSHRILDDLAEDLAHAIAARMLAKAAEASLIATPEGYQAFVEMLDAPAVPNVRLERLMAVKAPWEA